MDNAQSKEKGRRLVSLSLPALAFCVLVLIAGGYKGVADFILSAALFSLGFLLAVPMLFFYRTGEQKYFLIFFAGFILPVILLGQNLPFSLSLGVSALAILYFAACIWIGPLAVFTLLRPQVLKFIG